MNAMSWADGILGVWQWGKHGLNQSFDYHLRPACNKCGENQCIVAGADTVNTVRQGLSPASGVSMGVSGITRLAGLSGAAAVGLGAYGAHVLAAGKEGVTEEQKKAFEVANRNPNKS